MQHYDVERLDAAILAAVKVWQRILLLDSWFFSGPMEMPEPPKNALEIHHVVGHKVATIFRAPLDLEAWQSATEGWFLHAIGHELAHILISERTDVIYNNLDGNWAQEMKLVEEGLADHIATVAWAAIPVEEREKLMRAFGEAKKVGEG